MKIQKVGRERPVLYRGKFSAPDYVKNRLTLAQSQLSLADTTSFTTTIDLLYLGIDNILSAFIMSKLGSLTTTSHGKKIDLFLKYFGRKAQLRMIERTDLERFLRMWKNSRYQPYIPKWSEVYEMKLFGGHLMDFAVTEIARHFKSDEDILRRKIWSSVKIYSSDALADIVEHFLQIYQMEAESLGERYGGRLARKLANHWNFINVSVFTDKKEIAKIIDGSKELQEILRDIVRGLDKLFLKIGYQNFRRLILEIAERKLEKKRKSQETALNEAVRAAVKHSDLMKFRFAFNFNYDSSEPRQTLELMAKIIKVAMDEASQNPKSVQPDMWEALKIYNKKISVDKISESGE